MRDAKKKANSEVGHHVADHAKGQIKDAQSDKLVKAARSLGNDEVQQRIQKGNMQRDEMLAFITSRLGTIREAQLREMSLFDNQRDFWKQVSDTHKEDHTKPKPTQWAESAKVYEEAAYQMCRGSLDRGRQLMERALDIEQKTFGDLSKVVDQNNLDKEADLPSVAGSISPGQGCGDAAVPAEIDKLASEIQNVTTEFADPMVKKRVADPWWTLDEEEEEEEAAQ